MKTTKVPFTLSLHIPKTAGTTLESILLEKYGKRLYRYNYDPDLLKSNSARWIMDNFDAIHGHFDINEFDLSDQTISAFCFVREPYDRLVSHFNYYKQHSIDGPFSQKVHKGEVDFESFAFHENMKNLQSRMMGKYTIQEFKFIGNSKYFNSYISVVGNIIGENGVETVPKKLNVSKPGSKNVNKPSEKFMKSLKEYHSRDYNLFNSIQNPDTLKTA